MAPVMEVSRIAVGVGPRPRRSGRPSEIRSKVASSYADILGNAGLGDVGELGAVLGAWDATLSELRPAAVVCEHSPLLSLATHGGPSPR